MQLCHFSTTMMRSILFLKYLYLYMIIVKCTADNSSFSEIHIMELSTAYPTSPGTDYDSGNVTLIKKVEYTEAIVAQAFDQYGCGFLLVFGTFGNIVSLVVLRRKKMRQQQSSMYFTAISVTDLIIIFVGQGLRHWVRSVSGTDLTNLSRAYCKIWTFVVSGTVAYSAWILTALTVWRAIAVSFPLKSRQWFSTKAVKIYLAVLIVPIYGYYSYQFYYFDVLPGNFGTGCVVSSEDPVFTMEVRPWIEYILGSMIPFFTILICNVIIIRKLIEARRKKLEMTSHMNDQRTNQVTNQIGMLLTVSFAFIVLSTPLRINFILSKAFPANYWTGGHRAAINRLNWAVSIFLIYLNHSINFLLYLISGGEFRRELMAMILCKDQTDLQRRSTVSKISDN